MTLYLYKIGEHTPLLTIENVQNYTSDSVTATNEDGDVVVYAPIAEDCELSAKADCSEALRSVYQEMHPSTDTRIDELEALMADLLFGGERE